MADWQPIESAPKSKRILQYGLDCDGRGRYWSSMGIRQYDTFYEKWVDGVAYPSHWMELPEAPNG